VTTFGDLVRGLGGVPLLPVGIPFGPNANYYFVDPANGNNTNDGLTLETAVADISTAYGKCTANQHDTVFYIAGSSSISMSSALTWSKNYTHLIGICAPSRVGQRARIFQTATATGLSPLVTVSATGCIFANLYTFQGVDDATSLINWSVTGGRNYFYNVHFAGGGHATQAIDGGASLQLNGAAECLFERCTIGVDTIAAATGMAGVLIDGDAKRCEFLDCRFTMYAGNAGAKFVEVVDSAGFDRYMIFDRCLFINDAAATTMTEAFTVPGGMGSATHRLIVKDSTFLGIGDVEDNDRGIVYMNMGTITGGGNAGIAQVAAAT
jgi:hypothetical protein